MEYDGFINVSFEPDNLDRYLIRTSILKAVNEHLPYFQGQLLDIGCGKMPYREYILAHSQTTKYVGLDIEGALEYDASIKPDYTWDGIRMPFLNDTFDCALGTEVLEHCPDPELTLTEVYRVLKPGGVFVLTVPFLWNLHEVPHDEYRYTPFSLERHLKNSGFSEIVLKPTGGWYASMAQMLGLWVRRAPMAERKRRILSRILKPVVAYLIKRGARETLSFKDGQMITGIYGFAKK